jgi:hypothetical protein
MPYQLKSFAISAAILATASTATAQQPSPSVPQPEIPAPTGHRQPTLRDLPPGLAHEEQTGDQSNSASGGPQQPSRTKSRSIHYSKASDQNSKTSDQAIPKLNVEPSCKAAAAGSVVEGRNEEACLVDERGAQEELAKNWSQYLPMDKQQCVGLINKGGPASYVELLSCLQVLRDARSISASELGAALFENGKLDVRKMDASVFGDLESRQLRGEFGVTKAKSKKRRSASRDK